MSIMKRAWEEYQEEYQEAFAQQTPENYRELVEDFGRLIVKHKRLRDAVKCVVADLEENFDCDDGQPNEAMKIATELKIGLYGPGGF